MSPFGLPKNAEFVHAEHFADVAYLVFISPEERGPTSDDYSDKNMLAAVKRRIEKQIPWAWCMVWVVAVKGQNHGTVVLGGCDYPNLECFLRDSYYQDMKNEAYMPIEAHEANQDGSVSPEYLN